MYIRNILFFFQTFIFLSSIFSQNSQYNIVYLNNGTYLRGRIIELIPDKFLKISLSKNDTIEIQMVDVKLIINDSIPDRERNGYENGVKAWGYTMIPEFSFGIGQSEGVDRFMDPLQDQYLLMLTIFNGFTITPFIQLGIGLGLNFWRQRIFLPVYLDLRANVLKYNNTPFIFVNLGYSLSWIPGEANDNLGGAYAGLGAGAKFKISNRQLMVISLGYLFQQARQWQEIQRVKSKATFDSNFINMKIGFVF